MKSGATLTINPGCRPWKIKAWGQVISRWNSKCLRGLLITKFILPISGDDTVGGDTNGDGAASSPEAGGWTLYAAWL